LVPGGGVANDGSWAPSRANFLLPVKALSRLVRAKFRDGLRKIDPACFAQLPPAVWLKDWVVHCQPVGNGQHALKYLAPYIFRVAIGNKRILKLDNGKVTFRYRPTDTGKPKVCTLPALEFIRRFLQHVLPRGFVKVRYYGFLSHSLQHKLAAIRQQLQPLESTDQDDSSGDEQAVPSSACVVCCPACGQIMRRGPLIRPNQRSPP
jgi:hypothetical protein